MKKTVLCLAFTAAVTALTSCGKIEKEPSPDRTVHRLSTTATTTTLTSASDHAATTTVTTAKTDSEKTFKVKPMSFSNQDEEEKAVPQPIETKSTAQTKENTTASNTSSVSGSTSESSTESHTSSSSSATTSVTTSISTTTVTTTAKKDKDDMSVVISTLEGKWHYQVFDDEIYAHTNRAVLVINENGTFDYSTDDGKEHFSGSIKTYKKEDEYEGEITMVAFYKNDSILWHEFDIYYLDPDIIFLEGEDAARIVNYNFVVDDTDFTPVNDNWLYQELDTSSGEYVTKGTVDVKTFGRYVYCPSDSDEEINGKVSMEYEEYPDGTSRPYYVFNNSDGTLLISCFDEQIDYDVFYAGNGGGSRLLREQASTETIDLYQFVDNWEYQEYDERKDTYVVIGHLIIDENCYYSYSSIDGTENRSGKIRILSESGFWYGVGFYDFGQTLWTECPLYQDYDIKYLGEDENFRIERYNTTERKADDLIGSWIDGNSRNKVYISEGDKSGEYTVYIEAAISYCEYKIFTYNCKYDKKQNKLVCSDGTLDIQVYCDELDEPEITESYDNCSAEFYFKGNCVIWYNITDDYKTSLLPFEEY